MNNLKLKLKSLDRYYRALGLLTTIRVLCLKLKGNRKLLKVKPILCKHPLYLRTSSTDIRVYTQIFSRKNLDAIWKNSPETIIDAGANIGLASVYYANQFPHSRIIAIEAAKSNIDVLTKNTALYDNILVIHAALWCKPGILEVTDPGRGEWAFQVRKTSDFDSANEKVNAITIDQIRKKFDIDSIDFLKVDIEGAERELFTGASEWLQHVSAIHVETHDRFKPGSSSKVRQATAHYPIRYEIGNHITCSHGAMHLDQKNF